MQPQGAGYVASPRTDGINRQTGNAKQPMGAGSVASPRTDGSTNSQHPPLLLALLGRLWQQRRARGEVEDPIRVFGKRRDHTDTARPCRK